MKTDDIFPGSTKLVEGTLPPSSLLLIGPSGVGKTIFCKQFLRNGLIKGEPCIYVATNESPKQIQNSMKSFGFKTDSSKLDSLFKIVDCYSWRIGGASSTQWVITNPGDLAAISMTMENALRGLNNVNLVFDSITGLTSICNYNSTFFSKFLQIITARIKALNGYSIFVVAPEAHDQQFISYLRQIFDGTLEMKEDESGGEIKRLLRLFSLKDAPHKTHWTPFDITDKGIVVRNEVELRCSMCSRLIEDKSYFEMVDGSRLSFDSEDCLTTYKKLKSVYGKDFE